MGIKMKRSAVASKVPATTDLELGELGVNTYDGKLFLKKSVGGTESIVEVGPVASVAGKIGAVTLAKADVGLGNVDNTSDAAKPVSTATQTALNGKANTSHAHAITDVTGLQTALDGKASIADLLGKRSVWLPANALNARITNGAGYANEELATNDVKVHYWAFDASVSEAVQTMIRMPKSWNEGTVEVAFVWKHPATTTNFGVKWGARAQSYSDNEAMDAAWGSTVEVADTGGTTARKYESNFTAAITIGGSPAAGDLVVFEFLRDPADAEDTMAVDAHLIGVILTYTVDAVKDD